MTLQGMGAHIRNGDPLEFDPPKVGDLNRFWYRVKGRPLAEWTIAEVLARQGNKMLVRSIHPQLYNDQIWWVSPHYRTGCDVAVRWQDNEGRHELMVDRLSTLAEICEVAATAEGAQHAIDNRMVMTLSNMVPPAR